MEVVSFTNVTKHVVACFINQNIIFCYGIPEKIITDNGSNLNNKMMTELCKSFKIQHHNSSPYRPKMNGAVEATNKNIKKIVQNMVVNLQGLAQDATFCFTWFPYFGTYLDLGNSISIGVWHGCSFAC